jgi:hypothetical protein
MINTRMQVYKRKIQTHNLFFAFHTLHFHRHPACLTGSGPMSVCDFIKVCLREQNMAVWIESLKMCDIRTADQVTQNQSVTA